MSACKCGCGQDAGVYAFTDIRRGEVAGQPKNYVKGHNQFAKRTCFDREEINDFDLGWFVGMFEGEGYIGSNKSKPQIVIVSTDKPNLLRIQRVLGCGKVYPRKAVRGNKASWAWKVSVLADVIAIVEFMYPYLGARRRHQCRRAMPISILRDHNGNLC